MPRYTENILDKYMIRALDMMTKATASYSVENLEDRLQVYEDGLERLEADVKNRGDKPRENGACIIIRDQIELYNRALWIKDNVERLKTYFRERPDIVSEEDWSREKSKAVDEILSYVDSRPALYDSASNRAQSSDYRISGIVDSADDVSLKRNFHPKHNNDLFAVLGDAAAEYPYPGIAEKYPGHKELSSNQHSRSKAMDEINNDIWSELSDTEKQQFGHDRYENEWANYSWATRFEKNPIRAFPEASANQNISRREAEEISKLPYMVKRYGSETGFLDDIYSRKNLQQKLRFDEKRAIKEEEYIKLSYRDKVRLNTFAAGRYFESISPVEQYREDPETAINSYIRNEVPLEKIREVEKEFPGTVDKVWDKMRWAEKERFDNERFDAEYRKISWDQKKNIDKNMARRWFEKLSPSDKYKESESEAIQYFRKNKLTEEQIQEVESNNPGFKNTYWDNITLEEKKSFDKERFDKEFEALPWKDKVKLDKDYAEEYWKGLSNPEKINENTDRAYDEFFKNPIPWKDVEKINEMHPGFKDYYWDHLSEDQRFEKYPDELDRRTGFDPNKVQDFSVYFNINKQGEKYAESCWQKCGLEQKFQWNSQRVSKELIDKKATPADLFIKGVSNKNVTAYINQMTPDQKLSLAKPFFDKQFNEKDWEGKIKYHKDEAERRFREAKTIPDKINVDKGHTFDTLAENKTPLSTIEKEAGAKVREEYFSSLSAKQKREIYAEEYNRIWNEGSYNDKKKLDPKRARSEIFDPAPYEEKRRLNKDNALKYLSSLDEKERNMLHPEDALALKEKAIQEKNKALSSSKLSKDTQAEVEKAKRYVEAISDEKGKIKPDEKHSFFEVSKNLMLADKATIDDIYNLGRVAQKAFYQDDLKKKTENGDVICNSAEILESVNGLFGTKVLPENNFDKVPEKLKDIQKLGFKGKIDENGYVILPDEVKEKLAGNIRNLEPAEVESFSKVKFEKYIAQYHNGSLSEGKTLYDNNPGLRQPVDTSVQNETLRAKADIEKANLNSVKEMNEAVLDLKDQYKALRSHGPAIFDSKEYSNMKTAYNNFITAYDNVLAGKHPDGKVNDRPEGLSFEDTAELKRLKDEMSKAADTYTRAKFAQKGGGIDMHKTGQGADRLAFADALSEFKISPKVTNEISARQTEVKSKGGEIKKVSLSTLDRGSMRGRGHLEFHSKRLKEREQQRHAANTANKEKKAVQM